MPSGTSTSAPRQNASRPRLGPTSGLRDQPHHAGSEQHPSRHPGKAPDSSGKPRQAPPCRREKAHPRPHHRSGIRKPRHHQHECHRRDISPAAQSSQRGRRLARQHILRHAARQDADVVMRACLHAVHTQSAIGIAALLRQIELQFAAALLLVAANAVACRARIARSHAANLQRRRRDQRADEVKLPNRADVLAEAGAAKEAVHQECRANVRNQQPRRTGRAVPQSEPFIPQKERQHQPDADPLHAQPLGPPKACPAEAAGPALAAM